MSDPGKYRTKEEVEQWKQSDPLHRAEAELRDEHGLDEDAIEAIDEGVAEEMDTAVSFAESSPVPEPAHRLRNHYVEDDLAAERGEG